MLQRSIDTFPGGEQGLICGGSRPLSSPTGKATPKGWRGRGWRGLARSTPLPGFAGTPPNRGREKGHPAFGSLLTEVAGDPVDDHARVVFEGGRRVYQDHGAAVEAHGVGERAQA